MSSGSKALGANMFVNVVSAYILKDYEVKGKMDPYVKLKVGGQDYVTPVATDQGQHPRWGDNAQFGFLRSKEDKLICELWEDDTDTTDDYLGTAEILIEELIKKKITGEQKFPVLNKNVKTAELNLVITFDASKAIDPKKNAKEIAAAEQQAKLVSEANNAQRKQQQLANNSSVPAAPPSKDQEVTPNVSVQVVAAKIYGKIDDDNDDPYFIMKMGEQSYRTGTAIGQGQNPTWTEENAKHFFYRTDEKKLELQLWVDDNLGVAVVDIEELFQKKPSENKYIIFDKNKQQIGEVQLVISVDLMMKIDKIKHSAVIADAQKKANVESEENAKKSNVNKPAAVARVPPTTTSRSAAHAELLRKTEEIKARLGNIQVKIKPQPSVPYIEQKVHEALLQGMKKLAHDRPHNPIKELGLFLLNYGGNGNSQLNQNNSQVL